MPGFLQCKVGNRVYHSSLVCLPFVLRSFKFPCIHLWCWSVGIREGIQPRSGAELQRLVWQDGWYNPGMLISRHHHAFHCQAHASRDNPVNLQFSVLNSGMGLWSHAFSYLENHCRNEAGSLLLLFLAFLLMLHEVWEGRKGGVSVANLLQAINETFPA